MPLLDQLIFVTSFGITLTTLVYVSRFISAQLRARGYNISDLILIGLPRKDLPVKAEETILQNGLIMNSSVQTFAIIVGACGALFLFMRFGKKRACLS